MSNAIPASRQTALLAALGLGLAAWLLLGATPAWGQERSVPVEELKLAYVAKFPGFVTWPERVFANARAPLVIGVWTSAPLSVQAREAMEKERHGMRAVQVRTVKSWDEVNGCHLLYLPSGEVIPRPPEGILKLPILIVRGSKVPAPEAALSFVREGDRLRFDISVPAAKAAGLVLDGQLLKLARTVRLEPQKEGPP